MADRYVRSTDGSDADDGTTWALAKATLTGIAAIDTAGDRIFVSQAHAESTGAAVTLAFAGTNAAPTQVICGDDSAQPPSAVSTAGTVTVTGNFGLTITGGVYVRGLSFTVGTGALSGTTTTLGTTAVKQKYEACKFISGAANANGGFNLGSTTSSVFPTIELVFADFKFAHASQGLSIRQANVKWSGGSILSGGTSPTTLVNFNGNGAMALLEGLDLSNGASTMNIFSPSALPVTATIRNSKLPASWTGALGVPTGPAQRFEMHNCDSGDTNYRLWVSDFYGSIKHHTVIVRTGGASDGTTPLSWVMESNANAIYPMMVLASPEIVVWNDTAGSSKTVTVEVVTDNVTLTDGECWLEVQYLGTTGFPLGSFTSNAKANVLATAANQPTSSATWTTTGLITPVKQTLSVPFIPQEAGYIHAKVMLAKASTTVYVCPKVTVT